MTADKAWQIAVIERFGYCERCHTTEGLCGHHVIPRRYTRVRHDIRNGICLCVKCHLWAHKKPRISKRFSQIVTVKRGDFKTIDSYYIYYRSSKWSTERIKN